MGWTDALEQSLLEVKNLIAGILEVKLQSLLLKWGMNIDAPFKI